jgi:hypothetical protein
MKENENKDSQSNFSDITENTEYDTILTNSSSFVNNNYINILNKKNNNNVNKIDIYANEENFHKYLNELTDKINLNNNLFYIIYITELSIQFIILINDDKESIIHAMYLILIFFINLISFKYINNYTQFLTECFICFIIAMDILAYKKAYLTLFYILENIINYIFFRYYIEIKKEYDNSNIYINY